MTDHKFTEEDIIGILNAYVEIMCGKCNVKDLGTCCGSCFITAISQAADLINRQKAEIERFVDIDKTYSEVRTEAIKEFAWRLKNRLTPYPEAPFCEMVGSLDIDALVKEMTEKEV
jgi:hypothetical protein